jgi:hypothetical protein
MDWYILLTPLLLLPIIFLFRLVGCTQDFEQFEGGGRDDGDDGGDGSWTYVVSGPEGGEMDVASEPFKVFLPSGQTGPAIMRVTLSDDAEVAGDFSPEYVLVGTGVPIPTFIYTPHSVGLISIKTFSDNSGVANPEPKKYNSMINITFKLIIADPIPPIVQNHTPNFLQYIWPKFTIDTDDAIGYAGGSPQQMFPQTNPPGMFDKPFTITSEKVLVSAGKPNCSCDVYITRLQDADPNNPSWSSEQHLIGPETALQDEFQSDIVLTFILKYNPATSPPTDYPASDFLLTLQQPIP